MIIIFDVRETESFSLAVFRFHNPKVYTHFFITGYVCTLICQEGHARAMIDLFLHTAVHLITMITDSFHKLGCCIVIVAAVVDAVTNFKSI